MNTDANLFLDTAAQRDTSAELMESIFFVAGKDEAEAARVWENPSEEELMTIWAHVTNNGEKPATDFRWGPSGTLWALDIEAD